MRNEVFVYLDMYSVYLEIYDYGVSSSFQTVIELKGFPLLPNLKNVLE